MDKVTCIAFLLYQSSKSQDIRVKAIQLLNGDVSIRDLKRDITFKTHLVLAESLYKKSKFEKDKVQQFIQEFMYIEV